MIKKSLACKDIVDLSSQLCLKAISHMPRDIRFLMEASLPFKEGLIRDIMSRASTKFLEAYMTF